MVQFHSSAFKYENFDFVEISDFIRFWSNLSHTHQVDFMAKFSEILKNKNFLLLWLSQVISQFGDRLTQMALIALVFSRTPGSAWEMAKLFSFTIIPVLLFGPVAGVYVDRWSRQRTMFVCDLLRSLLVFIIAFFLVDIKPIFPIYVLIFLVFSTGRFFVPAKMSIIPDLVKKSDLLLANSLVNTTGMIAAMLGLGIGGILVSPQFLGVKGGFYLNAVTFLVSAAMIYFISEKIKIRVSKEAIVDVSKDVVDVVKKSALRDIKEMLKFLANNRQTRYIFTLLFMLFSALGAVYVITIVFIQDALGATTAQLGFLAMCMGASLFVGSLLYGRLGQKLSQLKIIFFSLILSGIALILFTILSFSLKQLWVVAALSFLLGLTLSPIMIASNTLIHRLSDNNMMGRVFSALEVVMHAGFLLAMFASASLAEALGRFWILIGVGIIITFIGSVGFLRQERQ